MQKRGLGRGLSDLGLNELLTEINRPKSVTDSEFFASELKTLPIDSLKPSPYQPRRRMSEDALKELADSIRAQGIIQPIVVRSKDHYYEIIAGERRWRAAQLVGLKEVPVVTRSISDETAMVIALVENIQRQDLNVMEEAVALQRLLNEFSMTHEAVAEAVGKSRTSVTNILRLLKLNADVQKFVEEGQLDMGHARALLALDDFQQSEIAKIIVAKNLSVRETEKLIRQFQKEETVTNTISLDVNIKRLQNDLSDKLGAAVSIRHSVTGKGKLIVNYNSVDELEGILERIQ